MSFKRQRVTRGVHPETLTHELESRLVEGMDFFCEDASWNVDADLRRELWFSYRPALIARWGPVEKLYAWYEFEASPEQRTAFRFDECPSPGYAVRDGEATVATPADPRIQALRAAQRATVILKEVEE